MSKRSVAEIDQNIRETYDEHSRVVDDNLIFDGRHWRFKVGDAVSQVNMLTKRLNKLYNERNQARFREWTEKINANKTQLSQ